MNPSAKQPRLLALLLLTLLLGWGVSTGCKKKVEAPPPPPPTPTPVIPPGSLVFVQRGHLVRLDLEASQRTPLTSGQSTEWFPACSPQGNQVAYWSNAEGGVYNLWKIDLNGSNRVQLTFDDADSLPPAVQNLLINDSPSWSADGKKLLYSQDGDLWEMDSDGYNPETLLTGRQAFSPIYSPDGKTVLFISNSDGGVFNLWSFSLSDLSVKKLTAYTDWNVGSPSFSADGRKVLFNLYRANTTQVYLMNADGTEPVNLTNNNRSLCPRFAQNDRKIVFCSYAGGEDVGLNVFMASATGVDVKQLTTDGGSSPTWAPSTGLAEPTPPAAGHAAPGLSALSLPTPVGK